MSSDDDAFDDIPADLTTLIGEVTVAYNSVQYMWLVLFGYYLLGDVSLARAMFGALRNDASQRDIILAAANVTLADNQKLLRHTQDLMKLTNKLAAERNAAVHTIWDQKVTSGEFVPVSTLKKHGRLEDTPVTQFARVRDDLKSLYYEIMAVGTATLMHVSLEERFLDPENPFSDRSGS